MDYDNNLIDLKLADFGIANYIEKSLRMNPTSRIGTRGYESPEALRRDGSYDDKVDSWALGVLLYNLVTG